MILNGTRWDRLTHEMCCIVIIEVVGNHTKKRTSTPRFFSFFIGVSDEYSTADQRQKNSE